MVKLYFAELPKDVQERFGYKPEKAVAYQSAQQAASDQARSEQKDSSRQKSEAARQQTETVTGSGGGSVHVSGYYRKDGTYVHPHYRAAPGTASHSRR